MGEIKQAITLSDVTHQMSNGSHDLGREPVIHVEPSVVASSKSSMSHLLEELIFFSQCKVDVERTYAM